MNKYIYIHVHIFVSIYMYTHIHIYIYLHIYTHTHTLTHTNTYTCKELETGRSLLQKSPANVGLFCNRDLPKIGLFCNRKISIYHCRTKVTSISRSLLQRRPSK